MLSQIDVKGLAILIQTLKPRKGSDELNYLEALHRWRYTRAMIIRNIIPEAYKVLFAKECPVPSEPFTSRRTGPKLGSQNRPKDSPKPTTAQMKIRYAGYDPTERNPSKGHGKTGPKPKPENVGT